MAIVVFKPIKLVPFGFHPKKMKKRIFLYILFIGIACNSFAQDILINYTDYKIEEKHLPVDSSFIKFLLPYADSMKAAMNKVIGFSVDGMYKKKPESSLGNFMADAMKIMAEKKFGKKVDAAFVNYGGIRYNLPKGDITIGNIFEIMPFDNLVVLQQVSGATLRGFLNKIAADGGWPVSGMQMGIQDKHAVNILIGGQPINDSAVYTIANSDYIANGGDDCSMLKKIANVSIGYLFRDALIEYTQLLTAQGKPLDVELQKRIYANQ